MRDVCEGMAGAYDAQVADLHVKLRRIDYRACVMNEWEGGIENARALWKNFSLKFGGKGSCVVYLWKSGGWRGKIWKNKTMI